MSTMCIDLREEPATGIGVDRCDQDCKQWEILRDVDPCLPDDQSMVQVPTTCPEKMVSVGTDGTASDSSFACCSAPCADRRPTSS